MDHKEENNIMIDNNNDYDNILMKVNNILLKLDCNYNDSIYDHSDSKISNILRKLDIISDSIGNSNSNGSGNSIGNSIYNNKINDYNDNNDYNDSKDNNNDNNNDNDINNNNNNDNDINNNINNNNNNDTDSNDPTIYEWSEYTEEHIIPDEGLISPVCTHILDSWTTDESKKAYLLDWASKLKAPLAPNFPQGIQFVSLSNVIKDGFLMLLIPSIRKTSIHPLQVFMKQSKKKIINNGNINNGDPFLGIDGAVYDIRVKVIGQSNENDTIINNSRNVSVDNTNITSNTMNISEIIPSFVSKTSSLFSGFFNKQATTTITTTDHKNDIKSDMVSTTNADITMDANNIDNNHNDNIKNENNADDSNNNNDTSRSSSTDLNLSPAERVKQRLAELRSKK